MRYISRLPPDARSGWRSSDISQMRYSNLFGKTLREVPKGEASVNAKLLIKGGFIQKLGAGIYTLLPLGLRVVDKISQIVREEMNTIGGQELLMPALHPREVWEESGRWQTLHGSMYQLKDSSDRDFALGFTHEEVTVDLARGRISSYRNLPLYLYQIQTKFRDEPRPRSGLIRGREFIMKDLYSFHRDQKDLDEFYETCAASYTKIFKRCGLETVRTKTGGGVFTRELTDEFQVISGGGEDLIFYCPSFAASSAEAAAKAEKASEDKPGCHFSENKEIAKIKEGDRCPVCGGKIKKARAIEVGNIFKFGTMYAEKMNMYYTDEKGNEKPVYLGSYGVGITRTMAAIVEVYYGDKGIVWPKAVAPFQCHLLVISDKRQVISRANEVYNELERAGIEVLFDDRIDVSPGEKFADCDLIGIPVRLVVSKKTGREKIERKERDKENSEILDLHEVTKNLR
jgi:prolyl-tRNA synthetase